MTNPPVPRFPAQPVSWSDVARHCRRICLLRECGQADAAEHLRRTALAETLAALRTTEDADAIEARLETTFAAEAERVANAAVLAELLAPLLATQRLSHDPFGAQAAPAGSVAQAVTVAPAPPEASSPRAVPARADPSDIAHFIDEMIAQERALAGTGPARRAS